MLRVLFKKWGPITMWYRLTIACWLLLSALCAHAEPLWDYADEVEIAHDRVSRAAISAWAIVPRVDQVYLRPESVGIPLPGRAPTVVAQRAHVFERGERDLTWVGSMGESEDQIMLTARDGWISGLIYQGESVYEIRPDGNHGHVLLKLDQAQFPACAGGIEPDLDFRSPESRPQPRGDLPLSSSPTHVADFDAAQQDEPVVIDVLVVYSAEAREELGGAAQIEAHAQAAVDAANVSFINSEVYVGWNVVHMAEISFTEEGSCCERLGQLRNNQQANALRDEYDADMVGMLLASCDGFCGCGYTMRDPGPSFEPMAFQVTQNDCAVGNLTYAHEHGHNMGMEHDPEWGASPSDASYPWSFGHFVNGEFRTIMSYPLECVGGCPKVPHFSNPQVSVQGRPTGLDGPVWVPGLRRDNARTARLTAPIIAQFRGSTSGPPPIQMLSNGSPVTDLSGSPGSKRFFSIAVPSGAVNLEISISGGTGNATLYVRHGDLPTLGVFDCRPYGFVNNEECSDNAPASGAHYIMLHGGRGFHEAAYEGVTLVARYNAPGTPTVTTEEADQISATSARLRSIINPRGAATTARFEFGVTDSYGSVTFWSPVGSDSSDWPQTATINGLQCDTTYNFRVVAENSAGKSFGANKVFATEACEGMDQLFEDRFEMEGGLLGRLLRWDLWRVFRDWRLLVR